jgi:hypothetical protein
VSLALAKTHAETKAKTTKTVRTLWIHSIYYRVLAKSKGLEKKCQWHWYDLRIDSRVINDLTLALS